MTDRRDAAARRLGLPWQQDPERPFTVYDNGRLHTLAVIGDPNGTMSRRIVAVMNAAGPAHDDPDALDVIGRVARTDDPIKLEIIRAVVAMEGGRAAALLDELKQSGDAPMEA